ncbi:MAG TPA: hypothetical protein VML56_10705, partial [Burkholderiales bacterium]|nr:hypothetical protein [Burkholderiales bacterium]
RDLGAITVRQLLETVRSAGEDRFLNPAALPVSAAVDRVLTRMEQALSAAMGTVTVKDLAADPVAEVPDAGSDAEPLRAEPSVRRQA